MVGFVAQSVVATVGFELGFILQSNEPLYTHCSHLVNPVGTSVKLAHELGEITFSIRKPKLTPGEV